MKRIECDPEWMNEEYESGLMDAYVERFFFDFDGSMKDWTPHPAGKIKSDFDVIGNKMHWWKYHAGNGRHCEKRCVFRGTKKML